MPGAQRYELVGWGITEACNLSCPHCYSKATKSRRNDLPYAECLPILDWLGDVGTSAIGWTGGEPLLRRDLEDLIRYAAARGMSSGVTTNGILLTRERVARLRDVDLRSLQVSLDGSTAEKNREIRRARLADFDRILNGIRYCLEAGIPVNLAMILGRQTLDDVRDYVTLARELGVQSVRFCGFVPEGGGRADAVQKRLAFGDRLEDLAALVDDLVARDDLKILLDPAFGPRPPAFDFHECIAGVRTFYISGTGDVYPCTGLIDERFKVGNVRERSVSELADDPRMREMADYDRDRIHGHCRECPFVRVCRGACRGAVLAHTGDLNASFPACLFRVANR